MLKSIFSIGFLILSWLSSTQGAGWQEIGGFDEGSSFVEVGSDSDSDSDSIAVLREGHLVGGRYTLEKFLHERPIIPELPGRDFPSKAGWNIHKFNNKPVHAGQGSFGDVWTTTWQANDKSGKHNVQLALKIFYTTKNVKGKLRKVFVTKALAAEALAAGHDSLHRSLLENKAECEDVRQLRQRASSFQAGLAHLCMCLESHISNATSEEPLFVVQENCGTSLSEVMDLNPSPANIRSYMADILKGVAFLSGLQPPLTHSDLKLENAVVDMKTGVAKLIDFGALRLSSAPVSTATSTYIPPEQIEYFEGIGKAVRYNSYDKASDYAFDVWSAGIMFYEFFCHVRIYRVFAKVVDRKGRLSPAIKSFASNAKKQCPPKAARQFDRDELFVVNGLLMEKWSKRMNPQDAAVCLQKINEGIPCFETPVVVPVPGLAKARPKVPTAPAVVPRAAVHAQPLLKKQQRGTRPCVNFGTVFECADGQTCAKKDRIHNDVGDHCVPVDLQKLRNMMGLRYFIRCRTRQSSLHPEFNVDPDDPTVVQFDYQFDQIPEPERCFGDFR